MTDKLGRAVERRMVSATLSADAKARILSEIEQGKDEKAVKAHKIFVATVAVAAATMIAAAAAAGGVLQYYWGAKAAPVYEKNHQELAVSDTQNGWKLTLDDCVSDEHTAYIGITLEAPEDVKLSEDANYFLDSAVKNQDGESPMLGWSVTKLPDPDPGDQKLSFVLWLNLWDKIGPFRGDFNFTFNSLMELGPWDSTPREVNGVWSEDGGREDVVLQPDAWTFQKVAIDCPNATVTIPVNKTIPMIDGEATLASVEISPLSLTIHAQGGSILHHRDRAPAEAKDGLCATVQSASLKLKDGSKIDFTKHNTFDGIPRAFAGSGGCDQDAGTVDVRIPFDTLLDLSQVVSIEVCGVEIPMPQ